MRPLATGSLRDRVSRRTCAAAILLTAAAPAVAGTLSYDIPVARSGIAFTGDIPLSVPAFNPGLGTLTGETLTMTGAFTPGESYVINAGPPRSSPVPVTLGAAIGTIAHQLITLPAETAIATPGIGGYTAFGTPEPFTVSGTVPAVDLIGYQPDIWAETVPLSPLPGYFATAELGTLAANLTVAYTYTTPAGGDPPPDPVPEPSTLAILGFGLIALAGIAYQEHHAP